MAKIIPILLVILLMASSCTGGSTTPGFYWSRPTNIFVMNADGSNLTILTCNVVTGDSDPSWSPDGSKIAFTSFRDGNAEIHVMNADGSDPINLTNNPAWDYAPAWSPDGTRIAFASFRDGD